jgi:hypothetical protein
MLRDCMQISGEPALQKLQGAQRIFRSNGSKELLALIGEKGVAQSKLGGYPKRSKFDSSITSP